MKTFLMIFVCSVLPACAATDPDQNGGDGTPGLGTVESDVIQCGIVCPNGTHPEGYFCTPSCGGDCSFNKNSVDCRPNTGTTLTTCGSFCPAPYHAIGTGLNGSCYVSASESGLNETFCHL